MISLIDLYALYKHANNATRGKATQAQNDRIYISHVKKSIFPCQYKILYIALVVRYLFSVFLLNNDFVPFPVLQIWLSCSFSVFDVFVFQYVDSLIYSLSISPQIQVHPPTRNL